jgi:flavin-dependent dehydrogenase
MAGGHLLNAYRSQLSADGEIAADGIVFVGDAVLTTNPAAGRGVSTLLMQAQRLLAWPGRTRRDLAAVTHDLDQSCEANMRLWYDDHVAWGRSGPGFHR